MERKLPAIGILEPATGTASDLLDRIETLVGRIGFNTAEQSRTLLDAFDQASARIESMDESQDRSRYTTRFTGLLERLRKEGRIFIRDLGGVSALKSAREQARPPADHEWWYIDAYLARQRRQSLRRALITLVVGAGVLALVAVIYNTFFAPDPEFIARYTAEQEARDLLANSDPQASLEKFNLALTYEGEDGIVLAQRGVVLEMLGRTDEAEQDFAEAQKTLSVEQFFLARAEAYAMSAQVEKALADTERAIQANPDSASAYLLRGQVYEFSGRLLDADQSYDQAFEAANRSGEIELAAIARTRKGILAQMMNTLPLTTATPTP